jgi:hypothetical protein
MTVPSTNLKHLPADAVAVTGSTATMMTETTTIGTALSDDITSIVPVAHVH